MLFGKKSQNKNIYRLKTMAGVRVLSEVVALIFLICLPFVLLLTGVFTSLDLVVKLAVAFTSVFSVLLLPAYGFITWQINILETGLEGWSLIKRRKINWVDLKKLTRKGNFNWQRYVLEYEGGDMTFPLLFERSDELISRIREHLPQDLSPVAAGPRVFRQDSISYLMQFLQVLFGLILSGTAGFFASHLLSGANASIWDSLLVMIFALLINLCMFYRAVVVALMPRIVVIDQDYFEMETLFFKKKMGWQKIERLEASNLLLPEGFLLDTREGTFLIGTGFDELDDLVVQVKKKLL